jgi:genome maintenance exonuclease 1
MFNYCPPVELPDLKSETFPDGKRYYVTPNGVKLPSVTTVVGATKKQAILDWRDRVGHEVANKISHKASSRGTAVHSLCENYLNNAGIGSPMPDVMAMFKSIKPYLDKIQNIQYQEQSFWSEKVGLAGRVDCIGEYEGKLSVIDFKTSSRVKTIDEIQDYFWQTTAYSLMYEELVGKPINNLIIIMAVEGDYPLVFKQKTKDHIDGLVEAIKYYRRNTK